MTTSEAPGASSGDYQPRPNDQESKREQHVHDRALRLLDKAFKEADDQLSPRWVQRDPDHAVFRETGDEEWSRLVERVDLPLPAKMWTAPRLPTHEREPIRFPPRPWGDPEGRTRRWLTAALVVSVAAPVLTVVLSLGVLYVVVVAVLVLAFIAWRARLAWWEERLMSEERRLARRITTRVEATPTPPLKKR